MDYPFGIDLSKYQYSSDGKQKPNFDLMSASQKANSNNSGRFVKGGVQ